MTLPEVILWDHLRAGKLGGHRFRRQHPLGLYVVDFYCPAARLVVEVDGAHHDTLAAIASDYQRDGWLTEQGNRVMRIAASDILDDRALDGTLRAIRHVSDGNDIPSIYRTRPAGMDT
jgi:very-short-patch-repair endonuclease